MKDRLPFLKLTNPCMPHANIESVHRHSGRREMPGDARHHAHRKIGVHSLLWLVNREWLGKCYKYNPCRHKWYFWVLHRGFSHNLHTVCSPSNNSHVFELLQRAYFVYGEECYQDGSQRISESDHRCCSSASYSPNSSTGIKVLNWNAWLLR